MKINWTKLGWYCVETLALIMAGTGIAFGYNFIIIYLLASLAGIVDFIRTGGFIEYPNK